MARFMLYIDPSQRDQVVAECRIRGITVERATGAFKTVEVSHDADRQDQLETIPGVDSAMRDTSGECEYGQTDCQTLAGGICLCGMPGLTRT